MFALRLGDLRAMSRGSYLWCREETADGGAAKFCGPPSAISQTHWGTYGSAVFNNT